MSHPDEDEVLFVGLNQDATSLAVGTKHCYRLYALSSVDELQKLHEQELDDVCIVERLFSSSLVTLVSQSSPRKLRVCHFQKGTEICHHSYTNTILAVRLNRLRLIVCLEEHLYIHNIRDMKVLHTIRDTPPNPQGLCELTAEDLSYLAYPGSSKVGEVHIFDAANLQAVTTISAHDSVLAAMKFNKDGTKLATASEKGTVIRVFSVAGGEKLFEFRRGMKRYVTIYSLAFSADSLFLCASSNTETVHVFKLEHAKDAKTTEHTQHSPTGSTGSGGGWLPDIRGLVGSAATYLPAQMTEMLSQDRAFATARLPHCGSKNVVALSVIKQMQRLLVASTEGYLYIFSFDKQIGGECSLLKQHCLITASLLPKSVSQSAVVSSSNPIPVNQVLSSGGTGSDPISRSAPKSSYAATVKGGSAEPSTSPFDSSGGFCSPPGKAVAFPGPPAGLGPAIGGRLPSSNCGAEEDFADLSLTRENSGGSSENSSGSGNGSGRRNVMPQPAPVPCVASKSARDQHRPKDFNN